MKSLSRVRLFLTPWTVAHQAPPLMGFSRQEYWNGVPLSSPIALTRWTFVGKVKSLLFNMLSAAAKSLQSCPTLCDPIDGSPPGSPVPGIPRQEHWSGLPFPSPVHESEKWKWSFSVNVRLFMTPWTAAYQAPPSMGFSRQEYWSGVPLPSPVRFIQFLSFIIPIFAWMLRCYL